MDFHALPSMYRVLKIGWFAFLVLYFALTACAPIAPATPTPIKGGEGEFRVVLVAEPQSLNPDLRSDDNAFSIGQNTFNKLITLDSDYRVIPDLAESWNMSADGLTYTFKLAKNVVWHDGKPFTSADVQWTLGILEKSQTAGRDVGAHIAAIETPDDATVVVKLKQVWAPFIPSLAWYGTFILPKHIYAGTDWEKNPANEKPIGTGPFKFVEWVKGNHITLDANRQYFRAGPYLDRVTFLVVPDSTLSGDMIARNQADYTLARPTLERIRDLQQNSEVIVKTFPHPARYYVGFNLRRQPLTDVRVRQAISMAINRDVLVDRAQLGYGSPGLGFYTPAVAWAFNPDARVAGFDATIANDLLDQAGMKRGADGTRVRWTLVTFSSSPFKEIALELQRQLAPIGVVIEPVLLAQADYTKRVSEAHDFDLAMTNGSQGPDPDNLAARFGSRGSNQFMGYASAEFDGAVAEGARLVNLKDRAQAYFRAQAILARDLPFLPLVENVQFIIYRGNVTGLPQVQARGWVTFQDYSLVRLKR